MQKLPKCLIFCKLHYVTHHQRFCRYCGIIQKAHGARDFLPSEISVQSAQDLLLTEVRSARADDFHSAAWWSLQHISVC